MSDDFEKEIRKLAEKSREKLKGMAKPGAPMRESDTDFKAVLGEFLKISEEGVRIFNESVKEERLRVYELPADFLEIFLDIPGRRGGLAIVSPHRLAIFFDEDPDVITVIGKLRNNSSRMQSYINKSHQLIKISFSKTESGYVYKDNTGKSLDAKGIISVIMGWLVQA